MSGNAVFYITENRIWVKQDKVKDGELEYGWDKETLPSILNRIKKKLNITSIRIILGNDISYSFVLKGREENLKRKNILEAAKLLAPEGIDNKSFDWKIVVENDKGDYKSVQVCGIRKEELEVISQACEDHNIKIEVMLPVTVFLANQSKEIKRPSLILWSGKENLVVVAKKGTVYHSQILSDNFDGDVKKVIEFASNKLSFELNDLVLDVKKWEGVSQIFPDWQENHYELDPFSEAESFGSQKGEDGEVLDLNIDEESMEKEEKGIGIWHFVVGGATALILGFGLFFLAGPKEKKMDKKQIEVIVTPMPTPTPINLNEYKIQVLNGSGVEGRAGEVEVELMEVGFTGIKTGNADSYDYGEMEINYKEEVVDEVLVKIEEALADYEATKSADLEDSEYDVVIVVGKDETEEQI